VITDRLWPTVASRKFAVIEGSSRSTPDGDNRRLPARAPCYGLKCRTASVVTKTVLNRTIMYALNRAVRHQRRRYGNTTQ
jgi:hypothetical protein